MGKMGKRTKMMNMMNMKITAASGKLEAQATDALFLPLFEKERLLQAYRKIDSMLGKELSTMLRKKQFTGSFRQMQSVSTLGRLPAKKVILLGLGERKKFSTEQLRRLGGAATSAVRSARMESFALPLSVIQRFPSQVSAQAFAEGALLSLYSFDKYKKSLQEKNRFKPKELLLIDAASRKKRIEQAAKLASVLSDSVCYARDLVNEQPAVCTPTYVANEAKKLGTTYGFKVTVFGRKEMEKHGMNAILAVASGSAQEPKLIFIENIAGKKKKKLALVGKGITFDSGGLNLKPTGYIENMKEDMHGAATVLGAMRAIGELKIKMNVVGVIASAENLTGDSAFKPGDILTAYNKKTIEVLNTDAEGRLVLADALSYSAERYRPEYMLDVATLTGACIVALGISISGLMGNDQKLMNQIVRASKATDEKVWQLPIDDEMREMVEGEQSDVRNTQKGSRGEAGTSTAGAFLESFVDNARWAHLDIAGTCWREKANDYCGQGATGVGVRLVTRLVQDWK